MSWGASNNSGPVATSGSWGASGAAKPAPTSSAGWGGSSSGGAAPTRTMSSNTARPASPAATPAAPKPATSMAGWGTTAAKATPPPAATPVARAGSANSSWGNSGGAAKPATTTPPASSGGWGSTGGAAAKPATNSWSSTGSGGSGFSSWGAANGWGNSTASSWASTPSAQAEDTNGVPKSSDSAWANDAMNAGQEAYQAFVDEMNLKQDVSVTTGRILNQIKETDDVANYSLNGLTEQNEKLRNIQHEMDEVHDNLNTCEKKMKQVNSFWGGWSTIGSSKTHDQHRKARAKAEKHADKDAVKQAESDAKQQYQDNKWAAKQNNEMLHNHVANNKAAISAGKRENMAEAKAIKKGKMDADPEEKQVWGGHVFEMRGEGSGPKCQAEQDLDNIHQYAVGLNQKANALGGLIQQNRILTDDIGHQVDSANDRMARLNVRQDKYCGNKPAKKTQTQPEGDMINIRL